MNRRLDKAQGRVDYFSVGRGKETSSVDKISSSMLAGTSSAIVNEIRKTESVLR